MVTAIFGTELYIQNNVVAFLPCFAHKEHGNVSLLAAEERLATDLH